MTKKPKRSAEDNRGVAIYARKSRITNKGDSIGVQFKQCAEYAKRELSLDENYAFLEYEDKGLSGYYSDRPDFQRMLHDIEMGKIRAVVCYKLDRIGRKTSDLLRLLDFLEKHQVDLLICSNNINTASGVSKIFIQIFAVVAEFERDTLTERITDNMMELAKDGRWLGGNTPTGFTVQRVKTGSGKNKSAYSYLESIPEEKAMIQKLYEVFAATRSIKKTADKMNELGYRTKVGGRFNSSTTRLLSFGKYAENAAPDVLVTLIQTFVERIYITDENDECHCHIFIKGCSKEDYDDFFRATGYIENTQENGAVTSVLPVCDSDECCEYYMILTPIF